MIAEPAGSDRYGGAMADVLHDASHPRPTRVERSFAFVDLSGFTRFTDVQGDDEAVDILSAFRAVVRGVASTHGVRIAKWLGDGAMLVGVEPEPLLEALVEIEGLITDSGSPLPLRAGFTTGPVILIDGDDYVGHAVNLAARLCAAAEPRQVLAIASQLLKPRVEVGRLDYSFPLSVDIVDLRLIGTDEGNREVVLLDAPRVGITLDRLPIRYQQL